MGLLRPQRSYRGARSVLPPRTTSASEQSLSCFRTFVCRLLCCTGATGAMFYLIKAGEVDVLPFKSDAVVDAAAVLAGSQRSRLSAGQYFGEVRPGQSQRTPGMPWPLCPARVTCLLCMALPCWLVVVVPRNS